MAVEPDFQAHLTTIGLGDITALYALDLYVIQLPPNGIIPTNIQLNFLPGLSLISYTVFVVECTEEDAVKGGCPIAYTPPSTPRLVAIPGLSKVYRFRELFIQTTALKDMTSFTGLTCPPSVMTLSSNLKLDTLNGLENIRPWFKDSIGPVVNVDQTGLTTRETEAALQTMALCDPFGASGISGGISMDVLACGNSLTVSPGYPCHLVWVTGTCHC
jgi:hypothetical protein